MENEEDISGLYEASGLKAAFEEVDKMRKEEKKKKEEEFWKDIKGNDDEEKTRLIDKIDDDIDPFWLK